jgi:hypothetical protein
MMATLSERLGSFGAESRVSTPDDIAQLKRKYLSSTIINKDGFHGLKGEKSMCKVGKKSSLP